MRHNPGSDIDADEIELDRVAAWAAERRARGSRAGTVSAGGASLRGLVMAEGAIAYGTTMEIDEEEETVQTTRLGLGMGKIGSTFRLR